MSLSATSDIVGTKTRRGLTGLLLVAIPVFLVGWMIIWPIISAIGRTIWLPNEGGGRSFSLETYRFFFTDQYSLNNLYVTLWTTGICALFLVVICLPPVSRWIGEVVAVVGTASAGGRGAGAAAVRRGRR